MIKTNSGLQISFLGTGTSQGIPVINCNCTVCTSTNPKNKRLRTSIIIESDACNILIDTSTDLRQQLLRKTTDSIDAILYTHAHADHICGIDDLRPFNFKSKKRIPVYGNDDTIEHLLISFGYAFGDGRINPGVPNLEANIVTEEFTVANLPVVPLHLWHGDSMIFGYRINNFAYCTDVSKIPDNTFKQLTNLEVLVVDALRLKSHPTHFSLDEAISAAQRIGAKKTYFIHMSHDIDHDLHSKKLPERMNFAYDGLSIAVK